MVACHGLRASKDSDKYLLLGREFTGGGLALARFDFRGCGESTGVEEDTTVGTRIADVGAVLSYLGGHPRLDGRLGLLGSSLGGFVALHAVSAFSVAGPVVTWSTPVSLAGLARPAGPEGGGLGSAFFEELAGGRYVETPSGVSRHLVIQGQADEVVPAEHGVRLHARAGEPRGLIVIEGGDHRLTEAAHRQRAAVESRRWFRRWWRSAPEESREGHD